MRGARKALGAKHRIVEFLPAVGVRQDHGQNGLGLHDLTPSGGGTSALTAARLNHRAPERRRALHETAKRHHGAAPQLLDDPVGTTG
jgi:hypothetical protein